MPELRRHYFLDEYCIIASERKKRPSDFQLREAEAGDEKNCPLCPGNEEMTPLASAVYTEQGVLADGSERIRNWKMRVFPNLFAAMVPSPSPPTAEWIALPGHGHHEVIVDSPQHQDNPADFGQEHMELLLRAYRDRYAHYRYMSGVNYISIFKNWGTKAGASFCLFCNIAEREATSNRLIAQNDSCVLIAPFYSQAPYEAWILPKRHVSNLEEMTEEDCRGLASLLKKALMSLRILLEDPPYNFMIYQLPFGYHLNIRIQPAVSKIAGFERGTGIYINSVPPEQAAAELRQA